MITPSFGLTATERVLPRLALDFTTASLDSRITFTRTTNASNPATYINSSGYVTSATDNQPRFDYNPVTLDCNGLLIEESRTNLILQSGDINNAAWTKSDTTIGNDAVVSPDGTQDADKLIETATTAAHFVRQNATAVVGTSYTNSIYLKAAERTQAVFQIFDGAAFNGASINLSTGAVTSPPVDVGGNDISSIVKTSNAGNGWWRISGALTQTTGTTRQLRITIQNGFVGVYAGDTSKGIYVWGAQIEAGAFATSYIPTTSAALTRNADVATMAGTNFSSWYNATQGTFRVDAITLAVGTRPIISADDDSANNSLLVKTEGTAPTFVVTQNGNAQASVTAGTITANSAMYAYTTYAPDYFGIARVSSRQVDTAGTVPTVDRLRIGASQAGAYLSGIISKLQFWN